MYVPVLAVTAIEGVEYMEAYLSGNYRISSNSTRTSNIIWPRIVSAQLPVLNEIVSAPAHSNN